MSWVHDLPKIYDDGQLLAVSKPAGIATMGVVKRDTLVDILLREQRRRNSECGNREPVFLAAVNRLDAPVTGVVLLARDRHVAAHLCALFRQRKVEKRYWACVAGHPGAALWEDWIAPVSRHRKMRTVEEEAPGARRVTLSFETLARFDGMSLVEIVPHTGRKHQIRLQFAARGFPVVGDRKYGSRFEFGSGIALHARSVRLEHPQGHNITIRASLPTSWSRVCRLGAESLNAARQT